MQYLTYLLDLYSYRKCFILICSWRNKIINCASCCLSCVASSCRTSLSLCYLIKPEGEVYLFWMCSEFGTQCQSFTQRLTVCSNAEVACWICACGTDKSNCLLVPVITFCPLMNKFDTYALIYLWLTEQLLSSCYVGW